MGQTAAQFPMKLLPDHFLELSSKLLKYRTMIVSMVNFVCSHLNIHGSGHNHLLADSEDPELLESHCLGPGELDKDMQKVGFSIVVEDMAIHRTHIYN